MTNTIESILNKGKIYLKGKGIESYLIDAQLLLMHVTGLSKIQLYTKCAELLSNDIIEKYEYCLEERGCNRPVAYITGICEFMSLDFYVNNNVLIPRPDTEILVEESLRLIEEKGYDVVFEIGTGSGCIAVSISHYTKGKHVIASDVSGDALLMAHKNAQANDCHRIVFVQSDLFENIDERIKADIIISNPPYIESGMIDTLSKDVNGYEPHSALDGGREGLDFYVNIVKQAENYLASDGMILFEIGYNQATAVEAILSEKEYTNIKTIKDLSGRDRVVCGSVPSKWRNCDV